MAIQGHRQAVPAAVWGGVRICGARRNPDGVSLGDEIGKALANCNGCGSQWDAKLTAPVGSFAANAFGLYVMVGNVWEWTDDCWIPNYQDAPADGSPWTSGDCSVRVVRGGSWINNASNLRSAFRTGNSAGSLGSDLGFRVARTFADRSVNAAAPAAH